MRQRCAGPPSSAGSTGAAAASQVYLLLGYLDARRLVTLEPDLIDGLRRRQRSFDRVSLRLAFELLDRTSSTGGRARVMSDRMLALIWTALLQRGGWSRKAACVASRLLDKLARDSSRLFGVPR